MAFDESDIAGPHQTCRNAHDFPYIYSEWIFTRKSCSCVINPGTEPLARCLVYSQNLKRDREQAELHPIHHPRNQAVHGRCLAVGHCMEPNIQAGFRMAFVGVWTANLPKEKPLGSRSIDFPPNGFKPPASSRFASAKLSLDLLS